MSRLFGVPLMLAALLSGGLAIGDEPGKSAEISAAMKKFVEDKEVAGVVTLVASGDKILHLDAVGSADIAGDKPMRTDTICWIASMTKPVTGTAVMMMQDAGKLAVDDPVSKYLPEFKELKNKEGEPVEVTIRQLLTHTSGLAEIGAQQAKTARTLADVIPMYVRQPVQFQPGSKWQYCQSSINTAARIVEVVSGESFPAFLEKRLFQPLGMKDTTFYLSEEQLPRLARSYQRTKEGSLEEAENFILHGESPTSRKRFPAANGGLFSTAPDYVRFCQMVLNGGELDGRRYLKPESVRYMTSVLSGDLPTGFTPGNGWGLGWCVIRDPQGPTAALSAGSFGHGGAYGTQAWIDPKAKRIYLLMVQRSNFPNADASDVRQQLQKLGRETAR
jgi:CubicO group peptidase (beta-lactamase class C family)